MSKAQSFGQNGCVILGGGGHAQVVIDSLLAANSIKPIAILDVDRTRWGQQLLGVPILGDDDRLSELVTYGIKFFTVGLGSISHTESRRRLFELGLSYGLEPLSVIHPSVICSPWAEIGPGSQLLPGCIINAGAVLGENVVVNSGAIVEHDCRVAAHVFIATGARLASTITIGRGAFIGAGAVVKQGLTIGQEAVVGAGAVVVKDVPPFTVVVGVPARPVPR